MHDVWCMWAMVCVHELRDSCPRGCSGEIFLGGLFPPLCHVWSTVHREHPARIAATWQGGGLQPENLSGKRVRISKHMHTTADHMHHTSCIMCIVTVWHPSIGNIIPILGYVTLDISVTVVTSGELWNWNQAVSETETWQLYGALVTCTHPHFMLMHTPSWGLGYTWSHRTVSVSGYTV